MNVIIDNADLFWAGMKTTLTLTAASAALALVLGVLLAACRVSPVPSLRIPAAGFVNLMQNLPLTVLFFLIVFGAPKVDIRGTSYWTRAVLALGLYTAAFVCEVVRSGINTVPAGQAEAARAIGLGFTQNLRLVILPQALRSVVGPMASTLIALTKNTSVAVGFSVLELTSVVSRLNEGGKAVPALFGVALCYLVLILAMSWAFELLERRVAFAR
ncbi:amino acid ABC transporter permease [Aquihabitans sp. G128]|uniref:amino acid ABC transporter permease n=1 Tax=Aquihabitans sp. G128 TaxID=2849779 RepID=UPI001C22DE69|nr:amino acid ABC transporter permease [Aquihabitans sp. G128]QXC60431.1 amino acid ABC transporter permease [Aquihabitans sp. G128]